MTDLISRKHALRVAKDVEDGNVPVAMIVALIDALPSAELTLQTPQAYGKSINPSNAEVVEDYISRADAMAEFREWVKRANENGKTPTWNDAVSLIGSLPSADAVQGEWIDIDNYYRMATCSHCHKVTMFEKWGEYTKPYDFCPNCGARMTPYKGGDDE